MTCKILFFFPHNPYPPKSGAHEQTLAYLASLKEIGCAVTLTSSTLFSDTKWEKASLYGLKKGWVEDIRIYKPTPLDYCYVASMAAPSKLTKTPLAIDSPAYTPPSMRHWFDHIAQDINPDVIFMNYVFWDRLIDHSKLSSVNCIIHTHDLISLNLQMQHALKKHLPGALDHKGDIHNPALREDFFDRLSLSDDPKECAIYDKYDHTIVVSAKEASIIKQRANSTQVSFLPVTQEVCWTANRYTEAALFSAGSNLFNLQGYLYFVKKVLPRILDREPAFSLHVTGSWYRGYRPPPLDGVVLRGFVPDLNPIYMSSRFVVCPVFGGTGQQVKIVEAMAHGLPVVALSAAAERSPMQHGVNGLVARNAEEFADYVIQLWNDKAQCRRLGEAARATIAAQFSRRRLIEDLTTMLGDPTHGGNAL